MKKSYQPPKIASILIACQDILTTSNELEPDIPTPSGSNELEPDIKI